MAKKKRPASAYQVNESVLTRRAALAGSAGQQFGGDRDLYEVFGYPTHLDVNRMRAEYERGGIAKRIVDAYPKATWREPPTIKAAEPFVAAFDTLAQQLRLWSVMQRLDRLVQLGHYGVLLLGLDGGEPMHEPAARNDYTLRYIQPHGEQTAQVTQWETNGASPRFGRPTMYNITTGPNWQGMGGAERTLQVHWTRVIHVAEDALESDSIGIPRLEAIFNRLMDTDKLLGGSAEMYWQNVAMMMAFIADKDTKFEPSEARAMAEQLEEMQHGLRRMLRLRGVDAKNIAPGLQGASPGEHIDKQLDIIAGTVGIPKRILLGNEAGELASSQDENTWSARVAERREQYATPCVLLPFIRAGVRLGFLPGGFESIEWPESDTLGEKGRAEVADTTARAVATYTNAAGADLVVTPDEFRAILGYDPLTVDELPLI